jgi:hypothetical protein
VKAKIQKTCKIKNCCNTYHAMSYCKQHYNNISSVKAKHRAYVKTSTYKSNRLVYHRTFEGMLSKMYSNIKQRCVCKSQSEKHKRIYLGRYYPTREHFIQFARSSLDIYRLYKQWAASEYEKDLKPSPDRINTVPDTKTGFTGGYELTNIRFITWKQNRELAQKKREMNSKKAIYDIVGKTLNVPGRDYRINSTSKKQKKAIQDLVGTKRNNAKKTA